MFEFAGLLYGVVKDAVKYMIWTEGEPKLVDNEWVDKSGFRAEAEKAEITTLRWSNPEKVASREADGYQIMFEVDQVQRVRRRIVLKNGQVLIGRQG